MRETYHHGDLRRALLDAARKLVRRDGASHVSLRAIAREAGVSPAAPYHHFEDREAILAAVAASGFEALRRAMLEGTGQEEEDPFRRLQQAGIAYVRFASENPELYRLMFSGLLNDPSRFPELERAADDAFAALGDLLGAARPGSRSDQARPLAVTAWSTVHGLAMLLLDGVLDEASKSVDVEEVAREVTRVLGRGLRAYSGSVDG